MVDSTADVESSLHKDVQALLEEVNSQSPSHKGRWRWTLEKRVEADPSCSIPLIRVLVKELETKLTTTGKINKTRSYMHVIPLLHTLYYVVIQSGSLIPRSLFQNVHECLMKMQMLPLPYSAVALSSLRSIEMEMITPGSLYQRRVTAEQNVKNEEFNSQEKVFVLADPAVFSAPLGGSLRAYLEVFNTFRDTAAIEKNLVLCALQKGLGTACQSSRLAQALQGLGEQMVEHYFQDVTRAVEQSVKDGAGGCATYMNSLQHIHHDILAACKEETTTAGGGGSVCSSAMPFPKMKFCLWKDEEDFWKLLADFTLCSSSSVDEEEKNKRNSARSEDSGTVRGLKETEADSTEQPPVTNPATAIARRKAMRGLNSTNKLSLMKEKMEKFPKAPPVLKEGRKRLTARVVVMGDNRVLGRLSRVYQSIQERESKHLTLTKKLNLQLYYVPVAAVEPSGGSADGPWQDEGRLSLASFLGKLDPWYEHNIINGLGAAISNLPAMPSSPRESMEQDLFLRDTLCYYLRCGTQPVNLPVYSVKMTRSSRDVPRVVEEVFVSQLEAEIPEFRHLKRRQKPARRPRRQTLEVFGGAITVTYKATCLSKRDVAKGEALMTCGVVMTSDPAAATAGQDLLTVRFDSMNPEYDRKIQTQNISIKTMEHRTLSVCLDKDARRTYANIQRIEVSPCLDPGCSITPLSKYLDKVLSLPINTFSSVTP